MRLSTIFLGLMASLPLGVSAQENPAAPETPATSETPPAASSLPEALKSEGRYDLGESPQNAPEIDLGNLQKDYPKEEPKAAEPETESEDFLFEAQERVGRLLQANVGIQSIYRPSHRFGLWGAYTQSVLSRALYRASSDSGLIDDMVDSGWGVGMQLDFSWVEKPDSPQPSNSSLRVRAGFFRASLVPSEAYLSTVDPSTLETSINAFHTAFLLKNAFPIADEFRSWLGGGFYLNYVLSTDRARYQATPSSKIANSLAFGPVLALGADVETSEGSEVLIELDYHLFKSWTAHLGLKTSL